ncbi:hypothetical protein [Dyadobacter psychrotolerans]|uniref:Uncharacterized protein n=1 Tax=Dyadobacter psychrotolerans TaxID=2541721 RepID=A0A4R5D8U4_9BACT|nr:hypothetical protein [Dyadobacter psychrotolerans]TDE08161.1 hypothetical protein E0F88_33125 [Dyadobacter psychrotolerans]
MKSEQQQIYFPVLNTITSKLGIDKKNKAGKKLEKEIYKTLSELGEDIEAIVKKRINKEDKQMVKELKHQQKQQRKERRNAAVSELLKNYYYAS